MQHKKDQKHDARPHPKGLPFGQIRLRRSGVWQRRSRFGCSGSDPSLKAGVSVGPRHNNEPIAYALDFVSYLISKISPIDRIILYGSMARGDFDDKSDVDLFIDTRDTKLEKQIQKTKEDYLKTAAYKRWSLKGFTHPFSLIVGKLDSSEWKNLKRALANTGIVLYGRYATGAEKTHQYLLLSFENVAPESKRIVMHRKLFGFTQGKKQYAGLVSKTRALKIGKGALLVPTAHAKEIVDYLYLKKVSLKLYDVWSDTELNGESRSF